MSVRVLLCEDYVALRELVRDVCEAAGHAVVGEASDSVEAAALAVTLAPDVVVLDLSSRATPAETIRPLAEDAPATAIVAYTGVPADALDGEARGRLEAHVSKSAPMDELLEAVERAAGYATAAADSAS